MLCVIQIECGLRFIDMMDFIPGYRYVFGGIACINPASGKTDSIYLSRLFKAL